MDLGITQAYAVNQKKIEDKGEKITSFFTFKCKLCESLMTPLVNTHPRGRRWTLRATEEVVVEDSQGDTIQLSPEESNRLIDDAIRVIDECTCYWRTCQAKKVIVSLKILTASCAGKWGEN